LEGFRFLTHPIRLTALSEKEAPRLLQRHPMNLWTRALIIGTAVETLLPALLIGALWGSCKPEGFELVLILLHYPALLIDGRWPNWIAIVITFVLCSLFWSVMAYAFLRLRSRYRR